MKRKSIIALLFAFVLIACNKNEPAKPADNGAIQTEVQVYLDKYNAEFQKLLTSASEAQWALNTRIIEGDTLTPALAKSSNEAFANFTGSKENIEFAKKYLEQKDKLTPLQVRQLEVILYAAGNNPMVAEDIVKKRIAAEADQTTKLFGFDFKLDGKSVTTNDIDNILTKEKNLDKRLKAWEASKAVGATLKDGLANLQNLRNESVKPLGYTDYFNYQVSDYNLTNDELRQITKGMIKDLWPLYRELHTWARYTLADRYKQPVPELLPAHWLPNRWGQEWDAIVDVKGVDLDKILAKKSPEWIMKKGEEFYMSIGFDSLPASFYEKSSLYPLPANAGYKKNNHASAWHMDNDKDVRSLMSVEPNTKWWATVLHELGHIYYYMEYSNPDVPMVLRGGANRAYHEGIGTMMGMAAMQVPFLQGLELLPANTKVDSIQLLLKEALEHVVVIPWGAGVMTEFEYELYAKSLPKEQYNAKWWELVKKYQGIVPPAPRGEEFCDAATKTHINDDAAQYYDYAMSTILFFQLHDYIAKNILKQDPHATNYWGNKGVGDFLKKMTRPGATVNWKTHLKETIGSDLSAKPMVDYFSPLFAWLQEQNKGRTYTLPATID